MNLLYDKEYWASQADITLDDLNRTAGRLARAGLPQDLKTILLPIIRGRLEHGHDPGPPAPGGLKNVPAGRIWDPDCDWQVGDILLLIHDRFGSSKYEVFTGEIVSLDPGEAQIKIDELQSTVTFLRTLPGTANAQIVPDIRGTWRETLQAAVETKLHSGVPEEQAEGILLKYGERLLTRLAEALGRDPRFTGFEGKWYLGDGLPRIGPQTLQALHRFLLQNQPASLEDLLPVVTESPPANVSLVRMAVHFTLVRSAERFENIGTNIRPQWKARPPAHDQAEVTHFAFDPQTFELLCRPGQRLTQKKARRLEQLNLYAHVVTFPEWHLPARM